MSERPDVLVLGGGGRQGDAWMKGLLAGLEQAHGFDLRECDYFVGTSAGSVLAAKLACGRPVRHQPAGEAGPAPREQPPWPRWAADSAMAAAAPFARLGLRFGRTPGEMARGAALSLVPRSANDTLDFHGAFSGVRFDGRLRVVAVDRSSGRRVVFGAPGAPQATVAQALAASCALPLVFPPAEITGREYVDGAIWSPTNLDVAPATRDARVLVVATMASLHGPWNAALRAACRAAMLVEAAALKARRARVHIITPDRRSATCLGRDLMSAAGLEPTQAAGCAQGLSLGQTSLS